MHNKNLVPLSDLLIDYISARSAPQILSLNDEYTFSLNDEYTIYFFKFFNN